MISRQFNSLQIFIKKEKSSRNLELYQPLFRRDDLVFLAQGPDHRDPALSNLQASQALHSFSWRHTLNNTKSHVTFILKKYRLLKNLLFLGSSHQKGEKSHPHCACPSCLDIQICQYSPRRGCCSVIVVLT